MLVKKTLQLSNCDIKIQGDAGQFSGYASVFGGVDSYGDTILRLSLIHISEPTRRLRGSRMPSSA